MRRARDRQIDGHLRAVAAFEHNGVAARLVHALKYSGLDVLVPLAVEVLEPRAPAGSIFVPVPRAWSRLVRYGVDPARLIAAELARRTNGQVVHGLRREIHTPRRAGSNRDQVKWVFRPRLRLKRDYVLVDDVLTTGRTALAAAQALLPARAEFVMTATSAHQVSSLFVPVAGGHQ